MGGHARNNQPPSRLQAQVTLERWLKKGNPRSESLWTEWREILRRRMWRKILGRSRRAQELRQASPLTTVLPDTIRQSVLDQDRWPQEWRRSGRRE